MSPNDPITSKILLYGPQNCGKTSLASASFNEAQRHDETWITTKLVASEILQEPNANIKKAFEGIKRYGVKGLFIEDIDQLFTNLRSTVAALQLLVEKLQDEQVLQLIIATARKPELLLDRELEIFPDIIPVLYPDENERVEIIKVYTRDCELGDSFDLKHIARKTEWWSGEEIRQLITLSKLDENLINSALLSRNIDEISERIDSEKRIKRMQQILNFTKEHSNIKSIREDSLSRYASLLTLEGEGCATRPQARLVNNDDLPMHPNIEILLDRMDDALKRADHSGVLHSSASIFETLAKEVVSVPSVQNQTLKSFFQKYRRDSGLPDAVLDFILAIYDSRNVTPLAGHGSTATPSISRNAGHYTCRDDKGLREN